MLRGRKCIEKGNKPAHLHQRGRRTSSASAPPGCSEEEAYAQISSIYEGDESSLPLPLEDVLSYLRKMRGCNRPEAKMKQLFSDTAPLIETFT
jgi:hypothetical protein